MSGTDRSARETLAMLRWLANLLRREDGGSTGLEWALIAEILVLGSVAALMAIRRSLFGD
jgi:hypothetical protein